MTKIIKVKNLETGMVHTVPDGHWSLKSPRYEVVKPKRKAKAKPVQ